MISVRVAGQTLGNYETWPSSVGWLKSISHISTLTFAISEGLQIIGYLDVYIQCTAFCVIILIAHIR